MKRLCVGIVVGLATTGGCIPIIIEPEPSPIQAALDENRAKWEAAGITSYEYRFENGCECLPEVAGPIIITVSNGSVINVRRPDDIDLPPREGGPQPTVESLFDTIQAAIDDEPGSIVAAYDEALGYPTQIYIDWDLGVADEETAYTATDLLSLREAEFEAGRAKWAALGLDEYEYTLFTACNCPDRIVGPNIMTVRDGVVTDIRSAADGTPIALEEGFFYPSIDDLFDRIQTAFDREVGGDAFSARYDDEFGYPTNVYIDWDPGTADEESSYHARDLVIPQRNYRPRTGHSKNEWGCLEYCSLRSTRRQTKERT